ncbi:uncharacterized protein DFL_003789 [Arthrobotrys flagrans]|uniref:Mitochondrial division protein 1 n=1 Tax=Arthrobotrys flagrans TaxID=97331 RepID=A0A437A2U5_ARTFL|nr:hypothetical protein DFL_003789 [Arthrobotrys flagrans]
MDIVAISGLNSHAFMSWTNRETGAMWLKDFLGQDVDLKTCRVMVFGYDTRYQSKKHSWIEDYAKGFLAELSKARETQLEKTRPLVWIGHSFGGTILTHAYVLASEDPDYKSIYDYIVNVFFFGVPFRGVMLQDVLSMAQDIDSIEPGGQGRVLVESIIYETSRHTLITVMCRYRLEQMRTTVIIFYEMSATPKVIKTGNFTHPCADGEPVIMVSQDSATLGSRGEQVIPAKGNHSTMVKIPNIEDRTYTIICEFLKKALLDSSSLIKERRLQTTKPLTSNQLKRIPEASGAAFDSRRREHQPFCYPGTRTELLLKILDWIQCQNSETVFWLNGMAGTGKSTIAMTVARELSASGRLGGSFFFSRNDSDLSSANKLFTTLARQLALVVPGFSGGLSEDIDRKEDFSRESLLSQWKELINDPLSNIRCQPHEEPPIYVFVIDALDECIYDDDVKTIITLLMKANRIGSVNIKIFFTSRPLFSLGPHLRNLLLDAGQEFVLHDINKDIVEADIRTYFTVEFDRMAEKFYTSERWPESSQLEDLTKKSEGLFIYAAVVSRFIDDNDRDIAQSRLDNILRSGSGSAKNSHLDVIYIQILNAAYPRSYSEFEKGLNRNKFLEIVGTVAILFESLDTNSLASLICSDPGSVKSLISRLGSVISVASTGQIRILHLSFREFLLDKDRCCDGELDFYVDSRERNYKTVELCLGHLEKLKRNICGLPTVDTEVSQVDKDKILEHIPPHLQYACRYWVRHLSDSYVDPPIADRIEKLLKSHLLHWFEAMSLLGALWEVIVIIDLLLPIIKKQNSDLFEFVNDAKRFILLHQDMLKVTPLQVYWSSLIFSPERSIVRKQNWHELGSTIEIKRPVQTAWNPCLQTLKHEQGVVSLASSPDGNTIASGGYDTTVKLWDVSTGRSTTLEGHSDCVDTLLFSPDSRRLMSGSEDLTTKLWNVGTGSCTTVESGSILVRKLFSPDGKLIASASGKNVLLRDVSTGEPTSTKLEGHSGSIMAISFSFDGKLIASCSDDKTIRLWDINTKTCVSLLDGHLECVLMISFSPDSRLIASSSFDKTIRLWDVGTQEFTVLEGRLNWDETIPFSPDSKLFAYCSHDDKIRLWDISTREYTVLEFEDHSNGLWGISFSPDGKQMASYSGGFIRLWDVRTRECTILLEGHSAPIKSISFSPDSRLLASGSEDETIKLWDISAGKYANSFKKYPHSRRVEVILFSPDGKLIASGSKDKTLKLWDAHTGECKYTLVGHSAGIMTVSFSLDSRLVASGSWDSTIKLWDAITGECINTLTGHSYVVTAILFSPDDRLIASGSADGTIKLWDIDTGECTNTLAGYPGWDTTIVFSLDGKLIASTSRDNPSAGRLWDLSTGGYIDIPEERLNEVSCLASNNAIEQLVSLSSIVSPHRVADRAPMRSLFLNMSDPFAELPHKLLLPPDYEPVSSRFKQDILSIGFESGQIFLCKFNSDSPSAREASPS